MSLATVQVWRFIPLASSQSTSRLRPFAFGLRFALIPNKLRSSPRCQTRRAISTKDARQTRTIYGSNGRFDETTIYALSTAPGRAAIAIIRISGKASLNVYRALCPGKDDPKPRYASLRRLYEPNEPTNEETVLDSSALVLYFPKPSTVTGEDVVELHVHGGPAVVKAVLAAISKCSTVPNVGVIRYAEPGEFTRRAFMNNRLDLTQVEALGDTLSATTEQQRRISIRGATSDLSKRYERWRHQLLYARGELEALIDFSEDQHFDESQSELCASVSQQAQVLLQMLQAHSQNAMRGEMLRNGISIALLGAPNAGKSSLLNCIVGRDAAIVSHEAGTTRDVVEVGLDLGGYFCRLGDTAGLRKSRKDAVLVTLPQALIGQVEEEGMRRAKDRAAESDVVIVVLSFEKDFDAYRLHFDPEVISTAANLVATKDNVIVAINKTDLSPEASELRNAIEATMVALPGIGRDRIYLVSCKAAVEGNPTRELHHNMFDSGNIQFFLQGVIKYFERLTTAVNPGIADSAEDPSTWQDSLGVSERQRLLLDDCISYLDKFIVETNANSSAQSDDFGEKELDIVIAAEHLRGAAACLAKITGRGETGDVEEVLGVVFEKFCVGK